MKQITPPPERTVYVVGEITEALAGRVIQELEKLDVSDGEIRVLLNSEGGHEQAGYSIYDAITMCRNEVIIDGYGSVMSIAAAILQAGDVRRLSPNCIVMVHNGYTGELGECPSQDMVVAWADHLKRFNKLYYNILSAGTTHHPDDIKQWCDDETYMTAREAVDRCFADAVIQPRKNKRPVPRTRRRKKREEPQEVSP